MDVSYRTTLELDKIIARAVQLCTCAETKEMMRAIEPFATTEEERYALAHQRPAAEKRQPALWRCA